MNEAKLTTLEDIRAFLAGTIAVEFSVCGKDDERYGHIAAVLNRFGYKRLKKPDKGLILRYLERTTDYSRQQLTRIIKRWWTGKKLVKAYCTPKHGLVRKFTDADIIVLAEMDSLHGTLSGPATRHLMARALEVFGDARYERLATISVGHLYNLRKGHGYIDRRRVSSRRDRRASPSASASPGWTSWLHPHRQASIRAIRTVSKASITSTPSIASPSGSWSPPARRSAKSICCWSSRH